MLYIAKINIQNGGFMSDIYFLENTNKDFITKFYDIGDGLAVSIRNNNEK